MTIFINPKDQEIVNHLRIDLAQATLELAHVQVHDIESRHVKERTLNTLRSIRDRLDKLGIRHASARRCDHADG